MTRSRVIVGATALAASSATMITLVVAPDPAPAPALAPAPDLPIVTVGSSSWNMLIDATQKVSKPMAYGITIQASTDLKNWKPFDYVLPGIISNDCIVRYRFQKPTNSALMFRTRHFSVNESNWAQ